MLDSSNSSRPKLYQHPVVTHPLQSVSSDSDESDHLDNACSIKASSSSGQGTRGPSSSVLSTTTTNYDPLSRLLRIDRGLEEIEHGDRSTNVGKSPSPCRGNENVTDSWILRRSKDNRNSETLWTKARIQILAEHKISENPIFQYSYIGSRCPESSCRSSLSSHVRKRLTQLDSFEYNNQVMDQVKEITNLSQNDYRKNIEQLKSALSHSWKTNQRVMSLKIVIQCAKLLTDLSAFKSYPSKFILVTDILDDFGRLVDTRIFDRASQPGGEESAMETCRNWFLKVASIRELTPRLYIELAILKTCGLLQVAPPNSDPKHHLLNYYSTSLLRISKMVNGIGNVVVASYVRCYICRVALAILDTDSLIFAEVCLNSIIENTHLLRRISRINLQTFLFAQKISLWEYYEIVMPTFEWTLQCSAQSNQYSVLLGILDDFEAKILATSDSSLGHNFSRFIILYTMIEKLPSDLWVDNLEKWLCRIKQLHSEPGSEQQEPRLNEDPLLTTKIMTPIPSKLPLFKLVDALGKALMTSDIYVSRPNTIERSMTLNEVWKIIEKLSTAEYMTCSKTWLKYSCKFLTLDETNLILQDIIQRIQPKRVFVDYYDDLVCMISDIVSSKKCLDDFSRLFALDNFSHMLDMIQKDSFASKACKFILETFLELIKSDNNDPHNASLDLLDLAFKFSQSQSYQSTNQPEEEYHGGSERPTICIDDTVIINQLTRVCKILHDSIGPNTFDDELRQMSLQIVHFLRLVTFDIDLNAELNYLTECRASFDKLEPVVYYLVRRCHSLAIRCRKIINRKRKKTPSFINSCLAYSYITIPTIESSKLKANLLLEGAQIALMNSSVSHADAFIKELIELLHENVETIQEMHRMKEAEMLSLSNNLLGLYLAYEDDIDLHRKSNLINFVSKLDCSQDSMLKKIDILLKIPKDDL